MIAGRAVSTCSAGPSHSRRVRPRVESGHPAERRQAFLPWTDCPDRNSGQTSQSNVLLRRLMHLVTILQGFAEQSSEVPHQFASAVGERGCNLPIALVLQDRGLTCGATARLSGQRHVGWPVWLSGGRA